jgi:hypothetical protein
VNTHAHLARLQQLTGRLTPSPNAPTNELDRFERTLAQHLRNNADLTIRGNRLPYEGADLLDGETDVFAHRIRNLESELARQPAGSAPTASPVIFRRETAFRSNVLGNSVPEWATGMAPSASYGPFLDEHGLHVWFDLFEPTRLISVYFAGGPNPVLRLPIWGTTTGRQSYRIEAGSVWIASNLIARVPELQGYYTGLKIRGGTLDLSQAATASGDSISVPVGATASLHLDLDQEAAPPALQDAGIDAGEVVVQLPKRFDLTVQLPASNIVGGRASCTAFGCEVDFKQSGQTPTWLPLISQILIPYETTTHTNAPDHFEIASSKSALCTVEGRAQIDQALTGWLLPAARIDPATAGAAAGIGSLCVTMHEGLSTTWRDLTRAKTTLLHPGVIVEPGLVTLIDFTASNVNGRQKWTLWRNTNARRHRSEVTLTFGKLFPFVFVSSSANSEGVFFFCGLKAGIDRPVDANGKPFPIQSRVAFGATLLTGKTFHALVLDTDLLDAQFGSPLAFGRHSLALRNALFTVSPPRSLVLFGVLEDSRITSGLLALTHDIYRYLPTLPDPYVSSYTGFARERGTTGFAGAQRALTGFVKWPDESTLPQDAPDPEDPRAFVYYKLTPLSAYQIRQTEQTATRSFLSGLRTFNQDLPARSVAPATLHAQPAIAAGLSHDANAPKTADVSGRVAQAVQSGVLRDAVAELARNPTLGHISNPTEHVNRALEAAMRSPDVNAAPAAANPMAASSRTEGLFSSAFGRRRLGQDLLMLLDVSTRADQMGVTLGPSIVVDRDERGDAKFRPTGTTLFGTTSSTTGLPLQIMNMDVATTARHVRAATLPQISWEPVWNVPLPIEGSPDPGDTITVTPGLVVYDNDGIPTRIGSESPYPVPIAPLPVTRHVIKEFNDRQTPRQVHSVFNLPFGMIAGADFNRQIANPPEKNAQLDLNMPHFDQLRGGLQIKALPPASIKPDKFSASFKGWTFQLDNLRWSILGLRLYGSTLGKTVRTVFNDKFQPFGGSDPMVPLERMELSGYGASIFSNFLDSTATIADVSQVQFDVIVGRTGHEVVQIRSILYPFGVHVVRTITLMRSNNGYVFRSDSGWKAESDGFYNFDYTLDLKALGEKQVSNPYEFHAQPVKGVSNVREIRDFPDGGAFASSFQLNDPDLPPVLQFPSMTLPQWQEVFANAASLNHKLDVHLQAVVFDADVHLDNVVSGGIGSEPDVVVQSRKMLGYVQLKPSSILIPPHIFADLLKFQNGSLGGPVDCTVDIAKSRQRMRLSRVDVNPATNGAGKSVFVSAARGSLILPQDGSWSVVEQRTDTGDVKPVPPQSTVPLIKPNASANYLIAHPADVHQPTSNAHYGVVQSTGTQKLMFDVPQFTPGDSKLKSAQTYFADAYKLLNSKGPFPNVANALGLTNAEREVQILGEGLMKMPERTLNLNALLPSTYTYPFIDEPGVLRIYAQYKSTDNTGGQLALGIDSAAALDKKWKAALSNIRVVVDLGPFPELMWVDGNFNASSGVSSKYDKPHLQFGPILDPVVQILQILATLSGEDFDRGMDVGMSNSADNWEYKFDCSKEIPVIRFPSPLQLTINPNPPLKLEAGLKVGFYFNAMLALPGDLKRLVPACGAYVEFYGRLQVQCFTLAVASVYAVGQVALGIAADSKAGITLRMKFGFGAEVVVGLPVVANVSVLYMVEVEVTIAENAIHVAGLLLFRGSAEILGGLIAIAIQIEAGGGVDRVGDETTLTAQVTFSIDVCLLWVIDINVTEHWEEQRQIA